jgi:hypothetical protein
METRTQIVTQLVAAMISSGMNHDVVISSGMKSDVSNMIMHARDIADEIIETTTEEIPFPETVV